MCVAIPAKIESIENEMGVVDVAGMKRSVSLIMLPEARVGDYVIVHAGFGIHTISEEQALESLEFLRSFLEQVPDPWGDPPPES